MDEVILLLLIIVAALIFIVTGLSIWVMNLRYRIWLYKKINTELKYREDLMNKSLTK
jgi:hypothetical protein